MAAFAGAEAIRAKADKATSRVGFLNMSVTPPKLRIINELLMALMLNSVNSEPS